MVIGIDARFFGPQAKGLGRYTQKLIEELEREDRENDYLVFLRRKNFDEYQPQNPRFKKILAPWRWYSLAEQLFFPWQLYRYKIGLMHFTHFNAPLFYRRPFVLTVHDLILQHWPTYKDNFFSRAKYFFKNLGYKIVIRSALSRAQKIIAVSRFVKDDIIKTFGVAEEKIVVVYEGAPARNALACEAGEPEAVNSEQLTVNSKVVLENYGIKKPYLLYVGNAYPHKNLERLIGAFKILRQQFANLRLVLVGGEDYFYRQFKKKYCDRAGLCVDGGVVFTGFVPDEELNELYASASLYVFPSLCEGFGLPPLEAMAQGVPVVASRATCLPEILGQAAHYFDGESPQDMAAKIGEVLSGESLRKKLMTAGFEQIKKYSWQKMTEETRKIYLSIDT